MSVPPPPPSPSPLMSSLAVAAGLTAVALSAAFVSGCGDPLVTAQDRGDVVFGVRGKAILPEATSAALSSKLSSGEYEVAVIFILVHARLGSDIPDPDLLEIEVVKGSIEGEFPASFRVELTETPRVYPFDEAIAYANLDGTFNAGMFVPERSPEGVRIGHLAIGPAAEIDALPSQIFFNLSDRVLGKALAKHLPSTTISPYQVLYAEGVSSDDLVYPEGGYGEPITGGMKFREGFTLIDARQYFAGTMWQECGNQVLTDTRALPEFEACLVANAPLVDCVDGCRNAPTFPEAAQCRAACYASYPTLLDANGCLELVSKPKLDEICGPEIKPEPSQQRILSPFESLTVRLGVDDVKGGMWMLHAQITEAPP